MDLSHLADFRPQYDRTRHLLLLNLEHGKANEMGSAQLATFEALCTLIERNAEIRSLCTTSTRKSKQGKPIFISGANVTERVGWSKDHVKAHVIRQRTLMQRLRRLPVFNMVLVHGITLGWGTEYVLTADYAIVTPQATFGLPETGLGILPGARGTAELATLVGPAQALRLGCTGESISAEEALRIGLVQEGARDEDSGMARVHALAEAVARRSPSAIAAYKLALLDGLGRETSERLALERHAYEHLVDLGDAEIGREYFDRIRAGEAPPWNHRKLPEG